MRREHDARSVGLCHDGVEEGRGRLRASVGGGEDGKVRREAVSPVHGEVSELAAPFDEEESPGIDLDSIEGGGERDFFFF